MKGHILVLEPSGMRIEVPEGTSLLTAIRSAGRFVQADCGGQGTCGKCGVLITPAPEPTQRDQEHLTTKDIELGIRLACQHLVCRNSRVILPETTAEAKILVESVTSDYSPELDHEPGLGVAIDMGTTTIVCYFMDLEEGIQIGSRSTLNPQVAFGEDVISRLTYAMQEQSGRKDLRTRVWATIEGLIGSFLADRGADHAHLNRVAVVGNTAMHHLALELDVESLALAPYTPILKDSFETEGSKLGLTEFPQTTFYFAPNMAGYVGGDALGFILSQRIHEKEDFTFGIDVGTNGEIVAVKNRRLVCCSAAAGPAFEGARITHGMRAQEGAIEYVRIAPPEEPPEISVIGNRAPVGLCGSAILDLVSELRRANLLHSTGRLLEGERVVEMKGHGRTYLVRTKEEGSAGRDIFFTQADVRQVQLAKAAIRAGIEVLSASLNESSNRVNAFYLAGAFGNYLRPESALNIGLLPPIEVNRIRPVGNAAGEGAKLLLLSSESRREAEHIAEAAGYVELANTPEFEELFYRATSLSAELGRL